MQRIDESRNGANVEIAVGEAFEIELAENPTTGYRWYLDVPDASIVATLSDVFEAGGPALGAPGRRRWLFRGESAGSWRLDFQYRRNWERSASRRFETHVRVKAVG